MVAGTGAARVVAGIGVWGHCYVLGIRGPTRRTTVFRHRLDDLVMPVGQAQRKGERLPSGARPGDWRSCGAVHVAYDSGLVVHHTRRCGVAVKLSYTFAVRRDSDRVEAMDRPVFGLSNRRRRRSCRVAVGGPIRWRRSGRPRSSRCWPRCRDCGRSFGSRPQTSSPKPLPGRIRPKEGMLRHTAEGSGLEAKTALRGSVLRAISHYRIADHTSV